MVKRVLQRAQAALTATALAVGIGCRDVASPDRENEREIDAAALDAGVGASPTGDPPIGPMSGEGTDPCLVGQLTVTTTSTGDVADLDAGYTIRLNRPSGPTQATGPNATVTFTALAEGTYEVFLNDVAGNCTVTSANPQDRKSVV